MKKILILVLIFTMIMSMSVYTFADQRHGNSPTEKNEKIKDDVNDDVDEIEEDEDEEEIENDEDEVENEEVEDEDEDASEETNGKKMVKNAVKEMTKVQKEINKIEKMQARVNMRIKALEKYSDIELENLKAKAEEIRAKYAGITPIDVDRIVSKTKEFKFDTPPVIKEGRTLVPVRAMVEAYGADVSWNQEDKEVTILINGDTIKLKIDNISANVNGEEVELDVPAKIINSRTVVPLRFVLESLGYEIEYEEETGTIEIIDDEDVDVEDGENEEDIEEDDVEEEDEAEDTDDIDEDAEDDTDLEDQEENDEDLEETDDVDNTDDTEGTDDTDSADEEDTVVTDNTDDTDSSEADTVDTEDVDDTQVSSDSE